MLLRPRQKTFVERIRAALKARKNTLGIAPTGAGKTVMLSAIDGDDATTLVLQHRDELVEQNERTFRKVNPRKPTSLYVADYKRWARDGGTTFSMIQTLCRDNNLATMPRLDRIIVDEGHHAVANSYLKVIDSARKTNPDLELLLVTATPSRSDRRTLRTLVDNVADQITLGELIRDGHLVRPRAFVIDTGIQDELGALKRKRFDDFDQAEVERIMNKRAINDKVVEHWKEKAGDRQTVVFCSTIQHAKDVLEAFTRAGVTARMVTGEMADGERKDTLTDFDKGAFQVIVNVAVLTEGWDCQPVSCVVLLRKESDKSVLIQMVGRGLRKLDPERYPGRHKDECIVLDFGYSLHAHRGLEQTIRIETQEGGKDCPECAATVPKALYECPICGFAWPRTIVEQVEASRDGAGVNELGILDNFVMTEVELLERSPYRYEDLFDGIVTIANAIDAWACVLHVAGRWLAVGGSKETGMHLLGDNNDRLLSLAAADDFLREHGDEDSASKQSRWLHQPASEKQLQHLGMDPMAGLAVSRYRASCLLTWKFSERGIKHKVLNRGLKVAA
jgi:DNA repair protein RadD